MYTIDLNSDLGEGFGAYTIGSDGDILKHVTSANIACGFHAGDPVVMNKTVALAAGNGVAMGAHPGLPDLVGFGRRTMAVTPEEAYAMVVYQVGALAAFAKTQGRSLQHVKPHGALYNMAVKDAALAAAVARAVHDIDSNLILFGLAGSQLIVQGEKNGTADGQRGICRPHLSAGRIVDAAQPGRCYGDRREHRYQPRPAHDYRRRRPGTERGGYSRPG
jgi:UPF0271 protein